MLDKNCQLCKRCDTRRQVIEPKPSIGTYKYLVVLDGPSKEDDYTGNFGSGNMGDLLRSCFKQAGVDFSEVHITGATHCYSEKAPITKEIEACKPFLLDELREWGKPDVIITMGSGALLSTLGKTKGVIAMRGSIDEGVFELDENTAWKIPVVPTFAPGIVFRDQSKMSVIVNDIRKAKSAITGLIEPSTTETFVARSVEDARRIRDILLESKEFSFDIETTGLSPFAETTPFKVGAQVMCVSFACEVGYAYVIPLKGQYVSQIWTDDEYEEICEIIAEILESDVPKVASNGKFDCLYLLVVLGIRVRNFAFDSQLGFASLQEEPPHNLEHMRTLFTQMERYESFKDDPKYTKEELDYWGYACYENEDLWPYAGADTDCELRVANGIRPLMAEESLTGNSIFVKKRKV